MQARQSKFSLCLAIRLRNGFLVIGDNEIIELGEVTYPDF